MNGHRLTRKRLSDKEINLQLLDDAEDCEVTFKRAPHLNLPEDQYKPPTGTTIETDDFFTLAENSGNVGTRINSTDRGQITSQNPKRVKRKLDYSSSNFLDSFEDTNVLEWEKLGVICDDDSDNDPNFECTDEPSDVDDVDDCSPGITKKRTNNVCPRSISVNPPSHNMKEKKATKVYPLRTPDKPEDSIQSIRKKLISMYGIEMPSPKDRKQTYANASFFRIVSALFHYHFHSQGKSAHGQPITAAIMTKIVALGKWAKLLKNDLDPRRALYRYMKNSKGIPAWFRGDSKTGYERTLEDGLKAHDKAEVTCPFLHCGALRVTSDPVPSHPYENLEELASSPFHHVASESANEASSSVGTPVKEVCPSLDTSCGEEETSIPCHREVSPLLDEENACSETINNSPEIKGVSVGETNLSSSVRETYLSCSECSLKVKRAFNLRRHFKLVHPDKEYIVENVSIPCYLCGLMVLNQNLKRHFKSKYCKAHRSRERTPSPEKSSEMTPTKEKQLKKDKRFLHCPAPDCQLWRREEHLKKCKKYKNWLTIADSNSPSNEGERERSPTGINNIAEAASFSDSPAVSSLNCMPDKGHSNHSFISSVIVKEGIVGSSDPAPNDPEDTLIREQLSNTGFVLLKEPPSNSTVSSFTFENFQTENDAFKLTSPNRNENSQDEEQSGHSDSLLSIEEEFPDREEVLSSTPSLNTADIVPNREESILGKVTIPHNTEKSSLEEQTSQSSCRHLNSPPIVKETSASVQAREDQREEFVDIATCGNGIGLDEEKGIVCIFLIFI